jgi:hypothetical protein
MLQAEAQHRAHAVIEQGPWKPLPVDPGSVGCDQVDGDGSDDGEGGHGQYLDANRRLAASG